MADDSNDNKPKPAPLTHTAFAMQRIGKKFTRSLEVGGARIDADAVHVFLDRLPIGGFSGYLRLLPIGRQPAPDDAAEEI